jgi:hypothetical protein
MSDQFQLHFDHDIIGVAEQITKNVTKVTCDFILSELNKTKKVLKEISKEEDDWGYGLKSPTVGAVKAKKELDRLNNIFR